MTPDGERTPHGVGVVPGRVVGVDVLLPVHPLHEQLATARVEHVQVLPLRPGVAAFAARYVLAPAGPE